jgi:hypothetical protein
VFAEGGIVGKIAASYGFSLVKRAIFLRRVFLLYQNVTLIYANRDDEVYGRAP